MSDSDDAKAYAEQVREELRKSKASADRKYDPAPPAPPPTGAASPDYQQLAAALPPGMPAPAPSPSQVAQEADLRAHGIAPPGTVPSILPRSEMPMTDSHGRTYDELVARAQRAPVTNPAIPGSAPPAAAIQGPQVFAKQVPAPGAAPVVAGGGGGGPSAGPYLKSLQDQQAAADRAGNIEAGMVDDQGLIQGRQAEILQRQQNEMAQQAAARDAQAQAKLAEVDAASKDAASAKQDPDRWWHSQGPLDKARLTLASFLGGFGAALTRTQDGVAATIDKHITDDIDAQRAEIEAKHGRVADLKGSLAEMYRRFGDMQQAEAGARILQLQHLDAEAAQYGATAKSALVRANAAQAHAQFQSEIERQKMKLSQGARQLTPLEQAQLDKTRAETGKTLAETDKLKNGAAPDASAPPDAPNFTFGEAVKSYLFPGSDAGLKRAQLEQHNTGVVGAVHKSTGLRGESLDKAGESYASNPFTPNALINQRNEAARRFSKGGAPNEPPPADFEEDDKP